MRKRAAGIKFVTKNPFAGDYICTRRRGND
jgi:hypothetical protein